jgi:hypothetical protein
MHIHELLQKLQDEGYDVSVEMIGQAISVGAVDVPDADGTELVYSPKHIRQLRKYLRTHVGAPSKPGHEVS